MALVGLNAQGLASAASKIEDAANKIDRSLNRISSIMAEMTSVWSDQNSRRYIEKFEKLRDEEFPKFKKDAHAYSEFLYRVVDEYEKEFLEPTSSSVSGSGTN